MSRSEGDGKTHLHCLVVEMAMFIESLRLVLSLDLIARMRCTVHLFAASSKMQKMQQAKSKVRTKMTRQRKNIYFLRRYVSLTEVYIQVFLSILEICIAEKDQMKI